MRSSLVRSVALAATCAAGLSASLIALPAQAADAAPSERAAASRFGYKANIFGTKVLVNNVEVHTLRDANLQMPCTRLVGVQRTENSLAALPIDNELIKVAASTSRSRTYAANGVNGVRATNTIADIELGGELGGVPTPVVKIQGLQSVADSFYDAKAAGGKGAFDATSSFGYEGLSLDLPEDSPISETLDTLFDALGVPADEVFEVVNVPVATLVDVLSSVGTITIPELGAITLGTERTSKGANFASAEAYALRILVDATGEDTVLQLGRASSRISRPVPAGVFRSTMSALELSALDNLVSLGGIGQRSIPCEGTFGEVRTDSTATASLVHEQLGVSVKGIKYSYKGVQEGATARGFTASQIGEVSIAVPGALDILIKGLSSRVDVFAPGKGQEVRKKVSTSFAQILVNGVDITNTLRPGAGYRFDNGVVRMLVQRDRNYYGTMLSGLVIQLTELDTAIRLGEISARFLTR